MINSLTWSCRRRIASRFSRIPLTQLSHIHHKMDPGESHTHFFLPEPSNVPYPNALFLRAKFFSFGIEIHFLLSRTRHGNVAVMLVENLNMSIQTHSKRSRDLFEMRDEIYSNLNAKKSVITFPQNSVVNCPHVLANDSKRKYR